MREDSVTCKARAHRCIAPSCLALILGTTSASAQTIGLLVHTWTDNPGGIHQMVPGDVLHYQLGVAVADDGSNAGLATIVYDVIGHESVQEGYVLSEMDFATSGYGWEGVGSPPRLRDIFSAMFSDAGGFSDGYSGGWGFDQGQFHGGNVTSAPGTILGAGMLAPLSWTADVNPDWPGLQPYVRLGVGHGVYTFPEPWTTWPSPNPDPTGGDPVLAGLQGGFGQDLSNALNPVEGDGTWVFQEGVIDTSGWIPQEYHFDVVPTNGAVFSPTIDYSVDQGGGFRLAVADEDMAGMSFSFTVVPEPTGLSLIGIAAVALVRRRSC
ncbi:MAG: PEP-CTERM sorting domain-containing protein [Phycisphaerales bacterium]|nr:MAG: PEP-CTERM sorting domain-containing protein [Phycisphaerales bacterium]